MPLPLSGGGFVLERVKNAVLRGIFPAGYLQMRPNAGIIYRVYPKADGPGRAAF